MSTVIGTGGAISLLALGGWLEPRPRRLITVGGTYVSNGDDGRCAGGAGAQPPAREGSSVDAKSSEYGRGASSTRHTCQATDRGGEGPAQQRGRLAMDVRADGEEARVADGVQFQEHAGEEVRVLRNGG